MESGTTVASGHESDPTKTFLQLPSSALPFTSIVHSDIYPEISPYHALKDAAKGLSVVVTGAGRSIGRSIALTFAKAGAKQVTITSRSALELEEVKAAIQEVSKDIWVIIVLADVTNEADVQDIFEKAGHVDVLINNAGFINPPTSIKESKVDEWFQTWEVNIKGTYLATRQLLRNTPETQSITIINVASARSTDTISTLSAYSPSKSGINRFTEFLHYENPNVRTFAIHPGGILTALSENLPANAHKTLTDTPELAGGYVLWLATQDAADFLRGRYSSANWDVSELLAKKQEVINQNLLWTCVVGQEQNR